MMDQVLRPFFYGSAENRLNSKGQVAIPKRFRDVVPQEEAKHGFVLVQGEAECIYMYTHRQFAVIKERVRSVAEAENDPEFLRQFLESSHAVDLDSQGRFVLPVVLRQAAAIDGPEVLFVGMDDRIEIWSNAKRIAGRGPAEPYEKLRMAAARKIFGL